MRAFAFVAALTLVATDVSALSCVRPDPVRTYQQLAADPASYYVIYGTLEFDASQMPKGVVNKERNPAPIAAQFRGLGLTRAGFTSRFERGVTLQPVCIGPWCGNEVPGIKSLFFAKVDGDDVIITSDPCGGTTYPEPSDRTLDAMTACINGKCP